MITPYPWQEPSVAKMVEVLRNGNFYTGTVEFVIAEADPDYVKEVLDEEA